MSQILDELLHAEKGKDDNAGAPVLDQLPLFAEFDTTNVSASSPPQAEELGLYLPDLFNENAQLSTGDVPLSPLPGLNNSQNKFSTSNPGDELTQHKPREGASSLAEEEDAFTPLTPSRSVFSFQETQLDSDYRRLSTMPLRGSQELQALRALANTAEEPVSSVVACACVEMQQDPNVPDPLSENNLDKPEKPNENDGK